MPLNMYSACKTRPRARLDRTCSAYSHAIPTKASGSGGGVGNDQPEIRPDRSKIFRPPERDIYLQAVTEQEDAKARRAAHDVNVTDRAMGVQTVGPLRNHLFLGSGRAQAERKINVGPAVEPGRCSRSGVRRAAKVGIILRRKDELCAKTFAIVRAEGRHAEDGKRSRWT
jgi:hypothetical protein